MFIPSGRAKESDQNERKKCFIKWMDLVNSFKSTSVKYFTVTFIIFITERYSYSRMILDYARDHQNVFDPSHNKVLTMDAMGLGNSRALTLQIITIRYPFLESPENFSGPKSHSYNCNPFFFCKAGLFISGLCKGNKN